MPSNIARRSQIPAPPPQRIIVSKRVAFALRPEADRKPIPRRTEKSAAEPPFAGEFRESVYSGDHRYGLPVGQLLVLCTLGRAWDIVGFVVDPGSSTTSFTAMLRVVERGINGTAFGTAITVNPGFPVASGGFLMGARCELLIQNATGDGAGPLAGIRGTIYGQSESVRGKQ